MREHICIRRPEYVAGTSERPEVGIFTKTHSAQLPIPWGKIASGETVWMKWTGGPVVARAKVAGYREFSSCSANQLRESVSEFSLKWLESYWTSLPQQFYALAIYLDDEEWLDEPLEVSGRSYGGSWVVFPSQQKRASWMTAPYSKPLPRKTDPRGPRTASASMRFKVFRRDGYTCQYCGRKAPNVVLHADHVIPWSKGGPTTSDNLITACRVCNLGKGVANA